MRIAVCFHIVCHNAWDEHAKEGCLVLCDETLCLEWESNPQPQAFGASFPPLHYVGSPMSPLYPRPPVCMALCLRGQCRLLHSSPPPGIVSLLMLTITYIQVMPLYIHTQCRFNNHTACNLYRILVMEAMKCHGCDTNWKYHA